MRHDRLSLTIALGTYPHTAPLKDGLVSNDRVVFDFAEVSPANRAFRPMVNNLTYDVSELALVTQALGKAFERPIVGIPNILLCESPHAMLQCRCDSLIRDPKRLEGMTLGSRAYTQTTATWTRGVLQDQYSVDLETLRWVTLEAAHVDGFEDPANVQRAASDTSLIDMVLTGEVDAAVGLPPGAHPDLRPIVSDVEAAEREFRALTGVSPINHIIVLREALADESPWLADELYRMVSAAREIAVANGEVLVPPPGLEHNRRAIELLMRYAYEQHLIPKPYLPEELFLPIW